MATHRVAEGERQTRTERGVPIACCRWCVAPENPGSIQTAIALVCLPAQTETLDNGLVPFAIRLAKVTPQAVPLAHFGEQAATGGKIVLVFFEVLGEIADLFRQDRHLHLGRTRIGVMDPKVFDEFAPTFC